jgi:hypothetical protein
LPDANGRLLAQALMRECDGNFDVMAGWPYFSLRRMKVREGYGFFFVDSDTSDVLRNIPGIC